MEKNRVKIHTSEHVLAALVGLDIDNVLIELDAPEPPIMDGSSKFFVEALEEAGIVEQEQEREEYVVKDVVSYKDETTGSEITIIPADEYQVTTMVDFGTKVLGTQNATLEKCPILKNRFPIHVHLVFFMNLKCCWKMALSKVETSIMPLFMWTKKYPNPQ